MRKNEIIEGNDYARSGERDFPHGWSRPVKVRVVENDIYRAASYRNVPRDYIYNDEEYVAKHLAWALTEAYPQDTTPRARQEAINLYRTSMAMAQGKYFREDETRRFIKGKGYDEGGILCRKYRKGEDGVVRLAELCLVPRREVRMEWGTYLAAKKQADEAKVRAQQRAAVAEQEREAKLAIIRAKIAAAFEGKAVTAPYVPSYGTSITFSYDQVLALLQDVAPATEAVAS